MERTERTRADHVHRLRVIRDELELDRERRPGSDCLTSGRQLRDWFNEALLGLREELGAAWVDTHSVRSNHVVRPRTGRRKRDQLPASAGRDHLLSSVKATLAKLGAE